MKGALIHGGLLAVMLIYGYQTWTRDKSTKPTAGEIVMWNQPVADVKTIEMESTDRTLRLERRGTGADAYWWGTETRTVKRHKPAPPPPTDPAAPPPPPPEDETVTDAREFPIGEAGTKLVADLAQMRAVKVVGTIKDDAKKDYGLDDTSKTIAIVFAGGSKTLVLGGSVFSGSDRYVMDVDTNKVFVVSRAVITPLEGGENSLKPLDLRSFDPKSAKQIEIAAADKTKSVDRIKVKKPADPAADPHAPPKGKNDDEVIETWGKGQVADQTAANFIDKLEKLRPIRFESKVDPATLTQMVALTYRDGHGKVLGTIKLMKRQRPADEIQETVPSTDPDPGPVQYYLITERTRVPARVPAMAADRVEQDIATVFGEAAPPSPGTAPGSSAGTAPGSAAGSAPGSAVAPGSATSPATTPAHPAAPATPPAHPAAPVTPPAHPPAPVTPTTPPAALPPGHPPTR